MLAHRIRITIPESHEVTVRLPVELPAGEAEVIVLAGESLQPDPHRHTLSFEDRFPRDPALAPIQFHEDPAAPLSDDDWPGEQRP
ncbi:MAG: hypothetical protein JW940_33545 [Polyangiaceae bacterium]|nr:hypothetical protein [Polyangiaceae bacterium]